MPVQIEPINKFGRNPDIDTAAIEDVWDGGGTWAQPTAARIHAVVSSSANDAAAGTGARTVVVVGLNSAYGLQQETVTLNGTTPVNTANSYIMIHRMYVATAGSGDANAGNITATAATDSTVTAQIATGFNQTLMAIYQVPAGYTGWLKRWYACCGGPLTATAVLVELCVKEFGSVFQTKNALDCVITGTSKIDYPYDTYPLKLPEKAIVKVRATTGANNTVVSAGFDIEFTPNLT